MRSCRFRGVTIPVVLQHQRELGADVNYSRKVIKTFKGRIPSFKHRCDALSKLRLASQHKVRLVKAAAYAKVLCATPGFVIPAATIKSLR